MANVPYQQTGLLVTVSEEGEVWLHFRADSQKAFGLNMNIFAEKNSLGNGALQDWIEDMKASV